MTLDELTESIRGAQWFANLGHFSEREGMIPIRTIEAWRTDDPVEDQYHESIAVQMKWLPSDNSEEDPIHGSSLKDLAKEKGLEGELRSRSLAIFKLTLESMRSVPHSPLLRTGPHDFNFAARSSAAYTARMATAEIVTGQQGFWCSLINLLNAGYLPCGLMPDGKLVVF